MLICLYLYPRGSIKHIMSNGQQPVMYESTNKWLFFSKITNTSCIFFTPEIVQISNIKLNIPKTVLNGVTKTKLKKQ